MSHFFSGGKRILFIGAHPDDIELGCGATIDKLAGTNEMHFLTLSRNLDQKDHSQLVSEHTQSLMSLGAKKENIILADFKTRYFEDSKQQISDYLFKINKKIDPDYVFTHCRSDIHQDHMVITDKVLRIFRTKSIFGFEVLRSSPFFIPQFKIVVSAENVKKKIAALSHFKTYSNKNYFSPEVIRSQAVVRGVFTEDSFAEAFEIYSIVDR